MLGALLRVCACRKRPCVQLLQAWADGAVETAPTALYLSKAGRLRAHATTVLPSQLEKLRFIDYVMFDKVVTRQE